MIIDGSMYLAVLRSSLGGSRQDGVFATFKGQYFLRNKVNIPPRPLHSVA